MKLSIPDVVDLFAKYYETHPSWGSLHVVLDDGNVKDDSVLFCIEEAVKDKDYLGIELARILLDMSKTQRSKLPYAVIDHLTKKAVAAFAASKVVDMLEQIIPTGWFGVQSGGVHHGGVIKDGKNTRLLESFNGECIVPRRKE